MELSDDAPLTRYQRRKAGVVLVGVKYEGYRIGRNQLVHFGDETKPVKFKRTGVYREARR